MPQTASSLNFTSYSDAIEHALDYMGGTADAQTQRDCNRAIIQAYRDVTNARTWTYLQTQGLIVTDPPFSQGTVAYFQSSYRPSPGAPAIPRALVLSGATWPAPAPQGTTVGPGWQVRLGTANYQVDSFVSPTVLTLSADDNPFYDLPSQNYILVHDEYLLPSDYIKQNTAIYESSFAGMSYADYNDYLWWQRYQFSASTPRFYTIVGSRNWPGRLSIFVWPYPVATKTIKWIYMRRPRDLVLPSLTSGKVTVTSGSTSVTGNGVLFPQTCTGCLLRLGTASTAPGSWISSNPPTFESFVQNWNSATNLTLNDPVPFSGTYGYNLTDPIDVEQTSMLTPVLRGIEKYLQRARNIQGKPDAAADYEMALKIAESADSRSYQGRAMGTSPARHIPYKYMQWTGQGQGG